MPEVQLLGRPECHLCELAQAVLHELAVAYTLIDVETSLELEAHYGLRIPVLVHGTDGRELGWPFAAEQVRSWLAERLS